MAKESKLAKQSIVELPIYNEATFSQELLSQKLLFLEQLIFEC